MEKKNKVVVNDCYGGFTWSAKAVQWLKDHYGLTDIDEYFRENYPRHDHRLVECVEELGDDASGDCANLQVVEFSGTKYRICEYDGAEWVETPDSISWINIDTME